MNMESPPTIIFPKEKAKNEHGESSHDHFPQKKKLKMNMESHPVIIFPKEKTKNEHEEPSRVHFQPKIGK